MDLNQPFSIGGSAGEPMCPYCGALATDGCKHLKASQPGEYFWVSEPQYVGAIPVRKDLMTVPLNTEPPPAVQQFIKDFNKANRSKGPNEGRKRPKQKKP